MNRILIIILLALCGNVNAFSAFWTKGSVGGLSYEYYYVTDNDYIYESERQRNRIAYVTGIEYVGNWVNTSWITARIPNVVYIGSYSYRVTSVNAGVFKGQPYDFLWDSSTNMEYIDDEAFAETLTTAFSAGKNFNRLGKRAFADCHNLKSVSFNCGILVVAEAFAGCEKIENITFTKNTTAGGRYSLSLKNRTFDSVSNAVITIANGADVELSGSVFSQAAYDNALVYVPVYDISEYKNRVEWKNFKNIYPNDLKNVALKFSQESYDAYIGKQCQPVLEGSISETSKEYLTWTIENEEIASVKNGVVTPNKPGKTVLSVSAPNGSTASCEIFVHQAVNSFEINIAGINIVDNSAELYADSIYTANMVYEPADATDIKFELSSSASDIVSVDGLSIITHNVGECDLTATSESGIVQTLHINVVPVAASGISINPTTVTLKVGENTTVTATVAPANTTDKNLKWTSSDETVAMVNENGEITGMGLGQCAITAMTSNGISANCMVSVIATPAQSISLDRKTAVLRDGETVQLNPVILPETTTNKFVFFESSDLDVATVDNAGLVTAHNVGEATITATTINGLSDECVITVVPTLATEITLTPLMLEVEVGKSVGLTVDFIPATTTDKTIIWQSSNQAVASVDEAGNVTGQAAGTARIIASTADGSGLTAMSFVTVMPMAGVDGVSIDFDRYFEVYNLQGILIQKDCNADSLKQLEEGVYILRQDNVVKKVIVP